nr:retrovirus-related Pol polyprotein from transposon TNT 1-94 [Tanacetum cinerariifolium]
MSVTIQSSVKDKILATPIDTSKVENALAEMMRDLDQQMGKRADDEIESSLTGLELVQETTDKVVLVKEKPKAAREHQKSYVDYRCKPLEFEVGDHVLLKVTPLEDFSLKGSRDSDNGGSVDDGINTTGNCFMLGSGAISWTSKKRETMAISAMKAKYIVATATSCQAVGLRRLMIDLGMKQLKET